MVGRSASGTRTRDAFSSRFTRTRTVHRDARLARSTRARASVVRAFPRPPGAELEYIRTRNKVFRAGCARTLSSRRPCITVQLCLAMHTRHAHTHVPSSRSRRLYSRHAPHVTLSSLLLFDRSSSSSSSSSSSLLGFRPFVSIRFIRGTNTV